VDRARRRGAVLMAPNPAILSPIERALIAALVSAIVKELREGEPTAAGKPAA